MLTALAETAGVQDAIGLSVALMIVCVVVAGLIMRAPRELRVPLTIFNGFYLGTTVIGATLLANPAVRLFWMLMLPSMDASWLDVWDIPLYWVLLWAPLIVVNGVALLVVRRSVGIAAIACRNLATRIDPVSYMIVGLLMVGFCYANLAAQGFLGPGLLDALAAGDYRANIQLRATMFASLGDTYYGLVFMGIPAICILALADAITSRRRSAWASFIVLSGALVFLYAATLTKSNIVIFGLGIVVTVVVTKLMRSRGVILALVLGLVLLTIMDGLLSGTGLFELARSFTNVVFRMASGVPFYVAIFPSQIPFVGLDVGLSILGIGPQVAPNLVVSNLMFPADTWVQGAVPAPAHIVGYAQGGLWWSLATMGAVGMLVAITGGLLVGAQSPLALAVAVGACIAVYYTTQAEFVGAFLHSYGLMWWLGALAVTLGVQKLLECATAGGETPMRAIGRTR